jgi:hypothetical protein
MSGQSPFDQSPSFCGEWLTVERSRIENDRRLQAASVDSAWGTPRESSKASASVYSSAVGGPSSVFMAPLKERNSIGHRIFENHGYAFAPTLSLLLVNA